MRWIHSLLKKQIVSRNVLFSSSVNWKKAASLESFRQTAVQQANSHSGRENWIREKSNQIKDTKEKNQDTKIYIPKELGGDDQLHRLICLLERKEESKWKERGDMAREVEALGSTRPFISCAGEEGGWFISGSLNCTFERQQSGACGRRRGLLYVGWDERPGLSPLPMSWRSLRRV